MKLPACAASLLLALAIPASALTNAEPAEPQPSVATCPVDPTNVDVDELLHDLQPLTEPAPTTNATE